MFVGLISISNLLRIRSDYSSYFEGTPTIYDQYTVSISHSTPPKAWISNSAFFSFSATPVTLSQNNLHALISDTSFFNCSSATKGGGLLFNSNSGGRIVMEKVCAWRCFSNVFGQFSHISSGSDLNAVLTSSVHYCGNGLAGSEATFMITCTQPKFSCNNITRNLCELNTCFKVTGAPRWNFSFICHNVALGSRCADFGTSGFVFQCSFINNTVTSPLSTVFIGNSLVVEESNFIDNGNNLRGLFFGIPLVQLNNCHIGSDQNISDVLIGATVVQVSVPHQILSTFLCQTEELNTPIPEQTPMESLIPDQTPMESLIPDQTPMESLIPDQTPMESLIPDQTPMESLIPDQTPMETLIPDQTPIESPIPDQTPIESLIPDQTPMETLIPDQTPMETLIPDQTPMESLIPDQTAMESLIPDQTPMGSLIPDQTPMESPIPDQTPMESLIPDQTAMESLIPDQTPIESLIPDQTPMKSPIPDQTAMESLIPDQTPMESLIPDQTPMESPIPDQTPMESLIQESFYPSPNVTEEVKTSAWGSAGVVIGGAAGATACPFIVYYAAKRVFASSVGIDTILSSSSPG